MIKAQALLTDLTRLLKRLEDDLRQRIVEVPELQSALMSEWQTARDAERTAETFESWSEQNLTQAGVHWLLSCVFLRFIEDNELVERPWLSGTPDSVRLALARDRHEAYFRSHPLFSDRDYLLACFREAGALPGLHTFFDERHNPVFRLGLSGDAAMALRQFWQQVYPNTGLLQHDFTDPEWNTRFLGDLYQDLSEATRKRYALLQTPEFVEKFILDRTLTPAMQEFSFREVRLLDPTCGSGHFLLGAFHRLIAEWQRHEPARNSRDIAQKALDAVAGVDINPFAVAIARFRLLVAALRVGEVRRLSEAPDFRLNVAIGDSLLHGARFGLSGTNDMFEDAEHYADTGLSHAYVTEDLKKVQRILGRQYHAVVGNPPYIVVKDTALNAAYRKNYASCHMKYSLGAPFTERFFELALSPNPSPGYGRGENNSQIATVPLGAGISSSLPFTEAPSSRSSPFAGAPSSLPLPHAGAPSSLPLPQAGEGRGEGGRTGAGYVGLITTNSFMKREFGSKLIEQVLPRLDLTHVIDTAGAYIPGHGTPTVILFGRHRAPVDATVRTVMGIKGEPSTPDDPSRGLVWSAILAQVDCAGSESEFVSVADTPRATFARHPWSVGGGGVVDLREHLEQTAGERLSRIADAGIGVVTLEDDAYHLDVSVIRRIGFDPDFVRLFVVGDIVRDWWIQDAKPAVFPHRAESFEPYLNKPMEKWFWPLRTDLANRQWFKKSQVERGLTWYEYGHISREKFVSPLSITFAEVATHNHFVLDRGGKVFNRTAPVIKLPAGSSEDEHLGLLGLLNSSVACFWLKQVCHNKGEGGGTRVEAGNSALGDEAWKSHFAFNSTKIAEFPLCTARPLDLASRLDALARQLTALQPAALLAAGPLPTRASLDAARAEASRLRRRMIALQEELDWRCYRLYGLLPSGTEALEFPEDIELNLGERAFEIVLARRIAAGSELTTWFERHGATLITELPAHWPEDYRRVVQRRIELIDSDRNIRLIERPEYKRRWNTPAWDERERAALRDWLLDRLETPQYWPDDPPQLTSAHRLAERVRNDAEFLQIAVLYAGHADFDLARLIADLVAAESVPFLPVLRYTETGLRKRAQWEATWALQRREDAGEAVGRIPVPPKYQGKDFLKADFWRLRGGLDVPKERWISYPGGERGNDGSLVIAWAGWNHLRQATALAAYTLDLKDHEGWEPARLQPLLAGLLELVPWLQQWHNDLDPTYGERMGDYYAAFVADEARTLGFTLDDLRAWKPASTASRRGRRKVETG